MSETFQQAVEESRNVFQFLTSSQLQERLFPLKIVFLLFLILFVAITTYFTLRTTFMSWWKLRFLKNFFSPKILFVYKITKKWQKIKKSVAKDSEAQRKLALINVHSLLDQALARMGHEGESLAEKLVNLTVAQIVNLTELQKAEQDCQDLLRDPDFRLSKEKTKEVIEIFETSFKELDLL